MAKKPKPAPRVLKVTTKMKKAGAETLASATEMDAEDLVSLIYLEMDKARPR